MKLHLITLALLLFTISSFGQELEFCGSVSTAGEQRFQNATGIGLRYEGAIGSKYKIGMGVHFNFNTASFDHIPYIDADPINVYTEKINSSSQRLSFRFNIQRMIKNNEHVSLSIGPELSYNWLWDHDNIDMRNGTLANKVTFTENHQAANRIGFGFISKVEVKGFISEKMSLCFSIRPEFIIGNMEAVIGAEQSPFYGLLGFTEFQIGLKYRLGK